MAWVFNDELFDRVIICSVSNTWKPHNSIMVFVIITIFKRGSTNNASRNFDVEKLREPNSPKEPQMVLLQMTLYSLVKQFFFIWKQMLTQNYLKGFYNFLQNLTDFFKLSLPSFWPKKKIKRKNNHLPMATKLITKFVDNSKVSYASLK